MDEGKKHLNPNPVTKANFVSRILYCWLNPLFAIGNKRSLEKSDIYNILEEESSEYLSTKLEKEWEKELVKQKHNLQPSLRRALYRTFGRRSMCWIIVCFIEESIKVIQPLLLGGLIRYFSPNSVVQLWEAYVYAACVGVCALILAVIHHPYFLAMVRYGIWMRIACSSLIYKKCLKLSNRALGQTTMGQIVNLLSNDVLRFDQSLSLVHFIIAAPLEVVAVSIILWYKIDWSGVAGISLIVLMLPVLIILSRVFARMRAMTAPLTDERVRLTNELLNAMRLVKMYCWENFFNDLLLKARNFEVQRIMKASYARAVAFAPFFYSAKLIIYATFLTYVLTGNVLTAEVVFVTISLYNSVRVAVTFFLPFAMQFLSEALVTVDRVQAFLLLEELDTDTVPSSAASVKEANISFIGVTACWDKMSLTNVLQDVSVDVRSNELLAVIGPVGTGKTSLLMAALGEIPLREGKVSVKGRIAYVSQQAWVFSASVRQNITFGETFDVDKYNRVVSAAALKKDLELMPEGDQTLVGDRGVSLSGGQKARISLARALYSEADVYLLDDPLSAVDAQVSNHIFNKAICGLLKKKPRILVTHQLQCLKAADRILVFSKDQKWSVGTYDELYKSGVDVEELSKQIRENQEPTLDLTSNCGSPKISPQQHTLTDSVDSDLNQQRRKSNLNRSISELSRGSTDQNELHEKLLSKSLEVNGGRMEKERAASVGQLQDKNWPLKSASMMSIVSLGSTVIYDENTEFVPQAQDEEVRVSGSVSPKLYVKYFYAGGGVIGLVLCLVLNVLSQSTFILADWWLAYWCNEIEAYGHRNNSDSSANSSTFNTSTHHHSVHHVIGNDTNAFFISDPFPYNDMYLKIFTGITFSVVIFGFLRALQTFNMLVKSADSLHKRMLAAILRCPISFFDNNPIGRILNRFSKDLGQIDDILPLFMYDFLQCSLLVIGVILVVGIVNPWVFIPTVPLCAFFIYLRQYFLKTSRNLKRLEATMKSPMFSHVSATVLGLQTIRAYRVQTTFTREFGSHQDGHSSAMYLYLVTSRWFAVRLEVVCALFITAVAICSVLARNSMDGGMVGLSLTYAMTLMAMFQWAVRQSSEVESLMTSVERIVEYTKLPPEAAVTSPDHTMQLRDWPSRGAITAENVELKYSPDGPAVLSNLNFVIKAGEKIGIVGRTGAGKSSLISMLFRLIEPTGKIIIDDVDILTIGLRDVRRKISIIPQDPVLLNGTVRKNLDPTSAKSELQMWHALQQVQLRKMVEDMGNGLDSNINEGGSNISMGQKQLFCLARAILMSNRIMIIDEATANVDHVTDALIQETIRQQFEHCTVLSIAHRLNTIVDSDRIMVLDAGQICEFDTPHALLQISDGYFQKMALQTGPTEYQQLVSISAEAHKKKCAELGTVTVDTAEKPTANGIDAVLINVVEV